MGVHEQAGKVNAEPVRLFYNRVKLTMPFESRCASRGTAQRQLTFAIRNPGFSLMRRSTITNNVQSNQGEKVPGRLAEAAANSGQP